MRSYSTSTPASPHISEKRAFKDAEQKRDSLVFKYSDRDERDSLAYEYSINRNRSSSSKTSSCRSSSLSLFLSLISEVSTCPLR